MKKVRIVTATEKNEVEFRHFSLLGQSLGLFPRQVDLEVSVFTNNTGARRKGLGVLYNTFLHPKYENEIILFVHDDVYLHDWHLVRRLNDAIEQFDVIGLAGNTTPDLDEPSWVLAWNREKYPQGCQPREYLTGVVGHIVHGKTQISDYGPTPQECLLMDGLFLAVNARKAIEASIQFDTQFEYHFYDLDFCRQCVFGGLKLGTWPIAVTHGSGGAYGSEGWISARDKYFMKWGKI